MSERQTTGLVCFVLAGAFLLVCLMTAEARGQDSQPSVEGSKLAGPVTKSIEDDPLDGDSDRKRPSGWWQTILALGLVIVLILAARFGLQRLGGRSQLASGPIEVLNRLGVGSRQQLMLVRFGERLILVGASQGALTALAEANGTEEIESLMASMKPKAKGGK